MYRQDESHRPIVPEITTQLPLPGEYVVLQLNPAAMAKHVGDPKLLRDLLNLKTDRYLAICGGYYESICEVKPWHMMHAYLCYDTLDPDQQDMEATTPADCDAQRGGAEETEETSPGSLTGTSSPEAETYQCLYPGCEALFSTPDVLVRHMKTHFKLEPQNTSDERTPLLGSNAIGQENAEDRGQPCPYADCPVTYSKPGPFVRHLQTCHSSSKPQNLSEEEAELWVPDVRIYFDESDWKPQQLLQPIAVRIRTRLCDLPRRNTINVPDEIYAKLDRHFNKRFDSEWHWDRKAPRPVPCGDIHLTLAERPQIQRFVSPNEDQYDAAEWENGPMALRYCLLPHCDYSFDLDQEVVPGKFLVDEQALIISMMRAAIPKMPLKAKIPARDLKIDTRDYYVEIPFSRDIVADGETPKWIKAKTERAKRRAKLHNSQTLFQRIFQPGEKYRTTAEVADLMRQANGIERPDFEILLSAPPAVLNEEVQLLQRKLSWNEWLSDLWEDLTLILPKASWSPPVYPHPVDDASYDPFEQWDKLCKQGQIERWRKKERSAWLEG